MRVDDGTIDNDFGNNYYSMYVTSLNNNIIKTLINAKKEEMTSHRHDKLTSRGVASIFLESSSVTHRRRAITNSQAMSTFTFLGSLSFPPPSEVCRGPGQLAYVQDELNPMCLEPFYYYLIVL